MLVHQVTELTKPIIKGEGPTRKVEYKCTTTMASSVAKRLIANKELRGNDDFAIPMREQQRAPHA